MFALSPWQASALLDFNFVASPFAMLPLPFVDVMEMPFSTYYSAVTVGSWFGQGNYIPGWANRFFAPSYSSYVPQSSYYPPIEDRARGYVDKAVSGEMINGRRAKANDAYSTAARAAIAETSPNADAREKILCEIADSTTKWLDNAQRRADFTAAYQKAQQESGDKRTQLMLANLLRPGSKNLNDKDLAQYAGSMLSFQEKQEGMTATQIYQALIYRMGGASVVEAMAQEVAAHC